MVFNPFPNNKLKKSLQTIASNSINIADFFSKLVENIVGKGEIDRYEQFLLFPQYFQKTSVADSQKPEFVL